jgi:2-methylcitrate dehydratase PrpD
MDYTNKLARYVAKMRWENIPPVVIAKSKIYTLDILGVALRGFLAPHAQVAYNTVRSLGGAPQATIIGGREKTSVTEAAFVNALSAHSIDFDDAHKFVHPGAAIVPTVLSIGESEGLSGKEFILAVVAGYEVSVRVSLAAGVEHRKRGYHPTGTCNFFGAAAAAAKALGLDAKKTEAALGIAGTQSAGLTQYRFDGSANKHFHAGMAARGGVLSALLAKGGYRGTKQILDGKLGFLNVMAAGGNPDRLIEGLGETFYMVETDIKPYPSCRQTHTVVDLGLKAVKENEIDLANIREVVVEIYDYANESWLVETSAPASGLQAMLNIPYCLASAMVHRGLGLDQFDQAMLREEKVNELARKVKIVSNEEFTRLFPAKKAARLIVTMHDGTRIAAEGDNPKGSVDYPLEVGDIEKKFYGLAEKVIGFDNAQKLADMVNGLEMVSDVEAIAKLLRKQV